MIEKVELRYLGEKRMNEVDESFLRSQQRATRLTSPK